MSFLPNFSKGRAINLLPKDPFEKSWVGKVLEWVLVAGKWTVIITELIVVVAFLMRFGLDRKLTDLKKNISKEVVTLKSYGDLEGEFVNAQKRLSVVSPVMKQNNEMMDIIEKIAQLMPADVWVSNLIVQRNTVTVNAKALSLAGFGYFVQGLEKSGYFKSISIANVETVSSSGGEISFAVSMSYGDKK